MKQLTLTEAQEKLAQGGLIIYPTETFFGIGCRADREDALARVFQVKKRLLAMPLPLILGNLEQLDQAAQLGPEIRNLTLALAERFWPGTMRVSGPAGICRHCSPGAPAILRCG